MSKIINLILSLIYIFSYFQESWTINVCQKCNLEREENGFYYGIENNEECIIDPQRCNTGVYKESYFNTCSTCRITAYIDHVILGWEDDKECVIDLDYCNLAHGNPNNENGQCKYCFLTRFDNQIYYGFENNQECLLNMTFCTKKVKSQQCNWCYPINNINFETEMVNNKPVTQVEFLSTNDKGEKCIIDPQKCGYLNMGNYNGTSNICTYCNVLKVDKDGNYIGYENNADCIIQNDICEKRISAFNEYSKIINASPRSLNMNVITNAVLLVIFITLML